MISLLIMSFRLDTASFVPLDELYWDTLLSVQPPGPPQALRKVIFIAPPLMRADRLDAK